MIKMDALHEHIRVLSETLAEKEINEEKLTTQQQQMKKLMTLLVPATSTLSVSKKNHDKKVGGEAEGKQMLIEVFRHSVGKSNGIFVNHFLRLSITNLREIIE